MKQAKEKRVPEKPESDATVRIEIPSEFRRRSEDSEQIERAVYDGMQDLRVKKPSGK